MGLSDLPLASGRQHRKVFESLGWQVRRDAEHIVLTHPEHQGVTLSIPNHSEVKKQTLKSLVRNARLNDRQYRDAFDQV